MAFKLGNIISNLLFGYSNTEIDSWSKWVVYQSSWLCLQTLGSRNWPIFALFGTCGKQENGEIESALLWRLESRINVTSFNEWEYFFSLVYIDLFLFTALVYWRKKMELCTQQQHDVTKPLFFVTFVGWCWLVFNTFQFSATTVILITLACEPHLAVDPLMLQHVNNIIKQLSTIATYQDVRVACKE